MRRASIAALCVVGCMVPLEPQDADEHDVDPPVPIAGPDAVVPDAELTPLEALLREHAAFERMRGRPPPETREQRRRHRRHMKAITRECLRAQEVAEQEIEHGQLGHAEHGLMLDCFDRYAKRAWERFGVAYHLMGCMVTDESGAFASCYNHVMDREITRRHGADVLDTLWDEVCGE